MEEDIKKMREFQTKREVDKNIVSEKILALESNIEYQKKIKVEYKDKLEKTKTSYDGFIEKIIHQQKLMDKRLVKIDKNLKGLLEAQEELAFLYHAHKSRTSNNTGKFLEYVRNFETKASLKVLRERLGIDRPSKLTTQAKQVQEIKPSNKDDKDKPPENQGGDEVTFQIFKDILRGVLREHN